MLPFGKPSYNQVRNATKNPVAIRMQAMKAKQICQKKFKESQDNDTMLYQFEDWLDDQIRRVQTKINGKEVKDKKDYKYFRIFILSIKRK